MAETPKTPRKTARSKAGSTTLSASEALKAAEAAIGSEPAKKKPAPKPARVKPIDANPQAARVKPIDANPQAASVKPIDANPQAASVKPIDANPQAASVKPIDANPQAAPEPVVEPVETEPKTTESLTKAEAIAIQPLPAIEGTKIMNDVIETGKKFAEETKAKFETAYADFNEKAKAGVEKSTKAIEELNDIAKGNVEALVESGKIAAKGIETLGQEAADYSRKSFEKATASFKSFSSVKTPTEFFQLQSQLLSSSFDEFTKEAAKNSEALIKLAGDVAQPLTARVTLVTDKVKTLAA
ncbi:phasin family protein [Sphingobium sp. BYY-5]|uniref:phasin family protein n=1 Tax=Sphingobium sp. BYY-5 TaxID=2926400 RepID=UPI001FA74EFA|nr:phasin family protein [Sphingobium sp. BYY-5]MCI4591396.1 phasin family protein [Sphingobium sp. BYY-5]